MSKEAAHRIPSLDGLRAVSIVAVLLGHLSGTAGFPTALARVIHNPQVDVAQMGVRVFFVISGFLITGLLRTELERTGDVSLSAFYVRRIFRIMPAYYAFIVVIIVLAAMNWITLGDRDLIHAATYTTNYSVDRSWNVGHLWSLSVEEQFYLLWPAVMAFGGVKRGLQVAVATMLLVPVIRVAEVMLTPGMIPLMGTGFETAADSLAVGCALALYREQLFARAWYRHVLSSRWMIAALFLVGTIITTRFRPGILIGIPLINIAIALGIDAAVRAPESLIGKLLNAKPLVIVGVLSYSIYLWQQLFLNRESHAAINAFPLNLLCVAVAATLSYNVIEKPFLRARVRFQRAWATRSGAGTTASDAAK